MQNNYIEVSQDQATVNKEFEEDLYEKNVYKEDLVEYENNWNEGSSNLSSIGFSHESEITESENSDLE
ncbi:45820_t:CDS:2 [Gigaspora margarita]|uniref:45820_t:CDS:1 n=1 Tax=Gigaspora margarita TaxID=4874 RepID=A0ABN7UHK1_GIGMA|nr:45820_t:CDS:2 [Gigaspora margarita]